MSDKVIIEMPKLDGDDDAKRMVCKIAAEVYALFPEVDSLSVARSSVASPSEAGASTPVLLVVLYSRQGMEKGHAEKVETWLKERLEVARIELFIRR